ncbi:MAG: glucose-1-phosphate thymidylyltransferase [Phycisphaerae bacterium]
MRYPWDIIRELSLLLEGDWRESDASIEPKLDRRLVLKNRSRIHVGERAYIHPTALIDATEGPIYISHDVRIGPYGVIEGPTYIGPGSAIRPHTWLHGGNAIGPVCRIGGEIHGCVICSYTNKQHAGFLGHAYVGSWVNIGAGATNSNLKNTYGKIRVPVNGVNVDTGQQFFGAIIGDHAKIGINATIPTGAVIGLSAVVASSRMLPKYVPSFSWVTEDGLRAGDPLRLLDAACAAMARRNVDMTDDEVELLLDLGTRVRFFEANAR